MLAVGRRHLFFLTRGTEPMIRVCKAVMNDPIYLSRRGGGLCTGYGSERHREWARREVDAEKNMQREHPLAVWR